MEARFFQQNVPGQWSRFDTKDDVRNDEFGDDGKDHDVEENDEFDGPIVTEEDLLVEKARELSRADVPEPIRRRILAERMGKTKTGVKGVLEDYRAHEKLKEAYRYADQENRNAILQRIAQGSRVITEDYTLPTISNLEESDDEEFMEHYRLKRMQELTLKANMPKFGVCKDVINSTFLEEIDKEDSRVLIIVHLYEPGIAICSRVNRFLEEIAHTHPNIKFLRMQASLNCIEVDIVTLPILTFYKGGESVHVLAGLGQEFGEYFKKEDLEWAIENSIQEINL